MMIDGALPSTTWGWKRMLSIDDVMKNTGNDSLYLLMMMNTANILVITLLLYIGYYNV